MRHILRQRELVADPWHYLGEESPGSDALIVPFAEIGGCLCTIVARSRRTMIRCTPVCGPGPRLK